LCWASSCNIACGCRRHRPMLHQCNHIRLPHALIKCVYSL
jgi:hypothetical protein